MGQCFPKPYEPFGGDINVKVDLSNYAKKADINISHVDTSSFALKTNLANLKTEVDKLDIDKLVPVPADLSKLGDVLKNDVIKKTDCNAKITEIENKIPDISNLATKTALTAIKNKIPNVSGLTIKSALTAVENKIPDINNFATKTALTNLSNTVPDNTNLIKKSDYATKTEEIERKYVSNTGFESKLAQANVITKRNFDAKIIELENNIKKLQIFDSSYFRGKSHFEEDGTQKYIVFQPIIRYFRIIANTKYISSWKSKGLSDESIIPYANSDNSLTPLIDHYGSKVRLKFNKDCSKQSNKLTYDYGLKVHVYIFYEFGASSSCISDPTLKNCLFGAVTLTKNADIEKYGYSTFDIGFDRRSSFTFPVGGFKMY